MAKTVAIPDYILSLGSAAVTSYYNLVVASGIGTTTHVGDNLIVSTIKLSQIKTALGLTTNSIKVLCESANVNTYSKFKPNGSSPYKMGDFAGYNHYAKAPTYFASRPTSDEIYLINEDGDFRVTAKLRRGEGLHGGSELYWANMTVVFELIVGTGLPTILSTQTITGVNVTDMYSSTIVESGYFTVPNDTELYRMRISAYYTLGGATVEIEDPHLYYPLTVIEYTAPLPVTYLLDMADLHGHYIEPTEGTNLFIPNILNDGDLAFNGQIRCDYEYYNEESTLCHWNGQTSGNVSIPAHSTGVAVSLTAGGGAIGIVDETQNRTIIMEYYSDGIWYQFFSYTYT